MQTFEAHSRLLRAPHGGLVAEEREEDRPELPLEFLGANDAPAGSLLSAVKSDIHDAVTPSVLYYNTTARARVYVCARVYVGYSVNGNIR